VGCDILSLGEWFLMFEMTTVPASSKVKHFKKNYFWSV
jgi:hypothetical protein